MSGPIILAGLIPGKVPPFMDRSSLQTHLIALLKTRALRTGQFTLASGKSSHYYVDGRQVTLSAAGASTIGQAVIAELEQFERVDAVGGLTMGADPIVGATLAEAGRGSRPDLRGFLVRKTAKSHGTGQLVEGPVESGMNVVIVEDVTTTGGSALQAVDAVEAVGCKVVCVLTLLDRLEGAAAAFERRGLDFRALVTIRDLGVEPLGPA